MAKPKTQSIAINIALNVSAQFLRDVLCTAVEGGSNYWMHASATKRVKVGEYIEYEQVKVYETGDGDGDETAPRIIGLAQMAEGVRRMIARDFTSDKSHAMPYSKSAGEVLIAVVNDDAGNVDADLADLILQCACFGHIVYG